MTRKEYEDRYADALGVIRRKHPGKTVGDPYTPARTRLIRIDGFPGADQLIFMMAWDEDVARDIMDQKPH